MTDDTTPIGPRRPPPDESSGTTASGRGRRIEPGSEWFWPVINLVGLIVVVAVNVLANVVPFNGQSTGEVISQDPIYFQPAGWTFTIWSLIYLLLLAFIVYSLLPLGRGDWRMPRIGPLFLVANVANIIWLFVWHYEQWWLSLIVMAVLLVALALIYAQLRRTRRDHPPGTAERLMVWTPFSVYLGWIAVAFVANVSVWRDRTGSDVLGVSSRWWAVLMILLLLAVTALMAFWQRDPAFTIVVVWAFGGIGAEQWDRSLLVAFSAIIAALLAVVLAIVASLVAFEQRAISTGLPQSVPPNYRSARLLRKGDPEPPVPESREGDKTSDSSNSG